MGVMDRFLNYMKINDEDSDYDDYYDDEDPIIEEKAQKASFKKVSDYVEEEPKKRASQKVTPIHATRRTSGNTNGMEVCVIKPTSMEDAREITDTLLDNRTVVLNLEGIDVDLAQRIIDFTSGSCFAIKGNLQKISHYIFIITPPTVDISGDFQEILSGSFDVPSF